MKSSHPKEKREPAVRVLFRNSGGQEPMRRGIVEEADGGCKEGKP